MHLKLSIPIIAAWFALAAPFYHAHGESPGSVLPPAQTSNDPQVEVITDEKDKPARTVYLLLEKVEGAAYSEVQIRPHHQRWANPFRFKVNGEELRVRLTPDRYAVRTRSMGHKKRRGEWSRWTDFQVDFRSLSSGYPAPNQSIEPTGTESERITFEWPKIDRAKAYHFALKDAAGRVLRVVKTTRTWMPTQVKVASTYSWCLLPLRTLSEEVIDTRCTYNSFNVASPRAEHTGLVMSIEERPGAIGYEFEVVRFKNDRETEEPAGFDSHEPIFRARIAPGEYEFRARAKYDEEYRTDWSTPRRVFVRMPAPDRIHPSPRSLLEATDDRENSVHLAWKPLERADRYTVSVYDSAGKSVHKETVRQPETQVILPEGATYHWNVVAYSPREPDRNPSSFTLDPAQSDQFTIGEYKRLDLNFAEEPSQLYGWGRYITSLSDYHFENFDANSEVRQSLYTGTMELAAGYWHRKSDLGILAQAGMAGYRFGDHSTLYKHAGVHLGHRVILANGFRSRFWLGMGYRELPIISILPTGQNLQIQSSRSAGPQVQISLRREIAGKLGAQLHGSLFYDCINIGTPNGLEREPQLSHSSTAVLTYPVFPDAIGMLGYTFKVEKSRYASDEPGRSNLLSLTGHYLTLGVEFALQPPLK